MLSGIASGVGIGAVRAMSTSASFKVSHLTTKFVQTERVCDSDFYRCICCLELGTRNFRGDLSWDMVRLMKVYSAMLSV